MPVLEITHRHGKALSPSGLVPTGAPDWIQSIDNPYLHGLFAPTVHEVHATELEVEGELPKELCGAYFRNGPNSAHPPTNRYHWFDGDGMVHGIWFDNGRAQYRNRTIQTRGWAQEHKEQRAIWGGVLGPFDFTLPGGPLKDTANTDLIVVQGKLLALWYESGVPVALDPLTLDTLGPWDFDGALRRASAHAKVDPATGDLIWFRYGDRAPYMTYGVVRTDGTVHRTDITLPGPRRPHDIGVTPHYSVLHDFPVFFDPELFRQTGKRIPVFHREVPTRFGVIPRFGTDADVAWFSFEPCYMLHVVNCWEDGDTVVMVGCRTADPTLRPDKRDGRIAAMLSCIKLQANLYRWEMNLRTGATREGPLDDLNAEFPMINPAMTGRRNRYAWLQHIPWEIPATFDGLVKYDLTDGSHTRHAYGPGVFGSEAPFVARPGATAEDDGWLVTFVTDRADWSSACLVYSAQDIEAGPIARVKLPQRVPAGFHAVWMDGAAFPA